jgi:hypothetical protein
MPFGFGRGRKRGWGRGFRGRRSLGDFELDRFPSHCICPQCGFIESHRPGIPCFQKICPQCSSQMTRRFPSET